MKYRVQEIELPEGNIYQHDALNRKPVVEFIHNFLASQEGPFTLALDSPWGTGKTTVVRMLQATLRTDKVPSVYFNAWKTDYASDPLLALISALDEFEPPDFSVRKEFEKQMTQVRKIATSVVKHGAVGVVKAVTLGSVDLDDTVKKVVADVAGDMAKDLVQSLQREKASLEKLREELVKAIAILNKDTGAKPFCFFIDELDRCRPTFAIETLERIKHLFDLGGLVFVLSIDKEQLEAAIGAVYGNHFDSSEYLRRFFDFELRLPEVDVKEFTRLQVQRFGLGEYFSERAKVHSTQHDGDHLSHTISVLAKLFDLSLRAIERAMGRVAMVCSQTPTSLYLDPFLVAFLVVLRVKVPDLFDKILRSKASPAQVVKEIEKFPGGLAFMTSHEGTVIETYLITGDSDLERKEKTLQHLRIGANNGVAAALTTREKELARALDYVPQGTYRRDGFIVANVAAKVEIASGQNR